MAVLETRVGDNVTVLPSAARTATPTIDQYSIEHGAPTGLVVVIDCTVRTAASSVVFSVLGYDPLSAKSFLLLASAAVASVSTTVLRISPHLTAAANLIAKDIVPGAIAFTAVHGNADSITYTLSMHVV